MDKIRFFQTKNDCWFVAKDIANILGYANTKQAIITNINKTDRQTFSQLNLDTKRKLQPHTILINHTGVQCLIQYGRRLNEKFLRWYEEKFDIKCKVLKRLCKEEEYLSYIEKVFEGEEMMRQYSCGSYNIDLYFPVYNIAIECDENGHQNRDKEYEQKREEYIKNTLNCEMIRFNPDSKFEDFFKCLNSIYVL